MFCRVLRAVRVGVDHDSHPCRDRRARVRLGEIAAIGVRVDLQQRPRARRRREDRLDVQRVGLAPLDQPARGVADRIDQWVLDRGDHPLGHLLLGHPERRVHARHDPVEPLQQLVLVVE